MDLAICMILLVSGLLCPLLMLGFGLISRKHPPKTINCWYGYRTARSMKSQAAWDFAHRYCGRLWTWLGAILLAVSAAVLAPVFLLGGDTAGSMAAVILLGVQVAVLLGSIVPVERALKGQFDEQGNPISISGSDEQNSKEEP